MENQTAGEIMDAHLSQPTVWIPNPSASDWINDTTHQSGSNQSCCELCSLEQRAANDSGNGGCEDCVDQNPADAWDLAAENGRVVSLRTEVPTAEPAAGAVKGKAHTERPEEDTADREVCQVVHNNGTGCFGSDKAGFQHTKAAMHEQNHGAADKNP